MLAFMKKATRKPQAPTARPLNPSELAQIRGGDGGGGITAVDDWETRKLVAQPTFDDWEAPVI